MTQEHCQIVKEYDGTIHAVSPQITVTATPGCNPKIFNRNGLRKHMSGPKKGTTEHVRWLVVRCNEKTENEITVYLRVENVPEHEREDKGPDFRLSAVVSECDLYP